MKTQTIVATAALVATAGIAAYLTRKKMSAAEKSEPGHAARRANRHLTHAFTKTKSSSNGNGHYRRLKTS